MKKLALLSVAVALFSTGCVTQPKWYFEDGVECDPYTLRSGQKMFYAVPCHAQVEQWNRQQQFFREEEERRQQAQRWAERMRESNKRMWEQLRPTNTQRRTGCESYMISEDGVHTCVNPVTRQVPAKID